MSASSNFPETLLRGIRKPGWLGGGYVSAEAFEPFVPKEGDGSFAEASINWEDDEGALANILARPEFKQIGGARVKTEELNRIKGSKSGADCFDYERKRVTGNDYHGNLLFVASTPKTEIRKITSTIALFAEAIPVPGKTITL